MAASRTSRKVNIMASHMTFHLKAKEKDVINKVFKRSLSEGKGYLRVIYIQREQISYCGKVELK